MGTVRKPEVRDEFLEWELMDKRTKQVHNLPTTYKGFADWKGTSVKTLRRWREDPEFQALLEQRKTQAARRMLPNATVSREAVGVARPATDPRMQERLGAVPPKAGDGLDADADLEGLSDGEREYQRVKRTIIDLATGGNAGAMDLYIKHWGKSFIAAEQEEEDLLLEMSDDELVADVIALLGPSRVASMLAQVETGVA